jgi:hypothetical protein
VSIGCGAAFSFQVNLSLCLNNILCQPVDKDVCSGWVLPSRLSPVYYHIASSALATSSIRAVALAWEPKAMSLTKDVEHTYEPANDGRKRTGRHISVKVSMFGNDLT